MGRTLPILKTLLFTVLVPGTVAGYVPIGLLASGAEPKLNLLGIVGVIGIALGAAGYFACAWNFAYHGLGTPAPIDPPKVLIVRGLNRYVRNPMYVSVLLVILGEAALFPSPRVALYGAFLWACAELFVLFYEEPALQKQFGASYEEYRKSVPRWIPRLFRPPEDGQRD